MENRKKLLDIYQPGSIHWVGDGFHVRNLFPSNDLGDRISPFLLLDYAGPTHFPPSNQPHGVGEHPHRGFETVTIVYQGGVRHRDSAGNQGTIGPGDVQWMTAASGVVHEEMHEQEFARRGGILQMVQLWVNLPGAHKMSAPRYQTLFDADIPHVDLPDDAGYARIIAGEYDGVRGLARTFTPMNVWDLRLNAGSSTLLNLPEGYNTALFVLDGGMEVNNTRSVGEAALAVFDRPGTLIGIVVEKNATVLVLNGAPIEEPMASHGPFVMNTEAELEQAYNDYRSGKMGHLY